MKKKVLVIAAHPDDEVVGCGGTLLKLKKTNHEINFVFLSDGVLGKLNKNSSQNEIKRRVLKRQNQAKRVGKILNCRKIYFLNYPNLQLHKCDKLEIIKKLIDILNLIRPDIIFIHSNKDLNPDHRIANECSITALRPVLKKNPKEIFSYEIPSSTDWALYQYGIFRPTLFFDIKKEIKLKKKLLDVYKSEMWNNPHPLSKNYLIRYASTCGSTSALEFCERFEVIKIVK